MTKNLWILLVHSMRMHASVCEAISLAAGTAEVPFNVISFQELLHRGTFKTVHHAIVNHQPRGIAGLDVAVKRLKGMRLSPICLHLPP